MINSTLIILAIIQSIAEFLPISSSGHLIIAEKLLNIPSNLNLIASLHLGTLLAIILYFNKDIIKIAKDILIIKDTKNSKLGLQIITAAIPAGIAGFLLKDVIKQLSNNLLILALGFGITSLLLIISSINFKKHSNLNYKSSLLIGLSQVFAIFPGISRLGATISTGILSGLKEKDALKFSFLLSIPITLGSIILSLDALSSSILLLAILSLIISLPMIHLIYTRVLINKQNLRYFGVYLLLLAISIIIYQITN